MTEPRIPVPSLRSIVGSMALTQTTSVNGRGLHKLQGGLAQGDTDVRDVVNALVDSAGAGGGASHESLTALRAVSAADAAGTAALLGGRSAFSDGGQGSFYFDSDSTDDDDGAMTIAPANGDPGRWKRAHDPGVVRAEWWGCIPLDIAVAASYSVAQAEANMDAINEAIQYVYATFGGGTVIRPAGDIVLADSDTYDSIEMIDDDEHGNVKFITLRGPSDVSAVDGACRLMWRGTQGGTVIKLYSRECHLGNMLIGPWGARIGLGLDVTAAPGTNGGICTANTTSGVSVHGADLGHGVGTGGTYGLDVALKIGDKIVGAAYQGGDPAVYPYQCDQSTFDDFSAQYCNVACVTCPNTTQQSIRWTFNNALFGHSTYGFYVTGCLGVSGDNPFFAFLTVANYFTVPSVGVIWTNVQTELCLQMFVVPSTGQVVDFPIEITGRQDCSVVGATTALGGLKVGGAYYDVQCRGPLKIGGHVPADPYGNWHVQVANKCVVIFDHAGLPYTANGVEGLVTTTTTGAAQVTLIGCSQQNAANTDAAPIPDRSFTVHGYLVGPDSVLRRPWIPSDEATVKFAYDSTDATDAGAGACSAITNTGSLGATSNATQGTALRRPTITAGLYGGFETVDFVQANDSYLRLDDALDARHNYLHDGTGGWIAGRIQGDPAVFWGILFDSTNYSGPPVTARGILIQYISDAGTALIRAQVGNGATNVIDIETASLSFPSNKPINFLWYFKTIPTHSNGVSYALGARVRNGANTYVCRDAITTSATAPTGTSTSTDGNGQWVYQEAYGGTQTGAGIQESGIYSTPTTLLVSEPVVNAPSASNPSFRLAFGDTAAALGGTTCFQGKMKRLISGTGFPDGKLRAQIFEWLERQPGLRDRP